MLNSLKTLLKLIIDPEVDSIAYIDICDSCWQKRIELGVFNEERDVGY